MGRCLGVEISIISSEENMKLLLIERFWPKVDKSAGLEGCWIWKACTQKDGYGQFWVNGGMLQAHRVAYELVIGPIPKGLEILHKCDNPPCVNPFHLWAGTQSENILDSMHKGRQGGELSGTSKLKSFQVAEIKRSNLPPYRLAEFYHVDSSTIQDILHGRTWSRIR